MAQIATTNDITVLKIQSFLGLNENPDGNTTLKPGEMAEMRNFRVTKDKHLQIRPGTKTVLQLGDGASGQLWGVWRGTVGNGEHILAAYGGHIWDVDLGNAGARDLGTVTEDETTFFPFGGKVYLLNGHEYLSWDGGDSTTFQRVDGYIPLIQTATTPAGAGTLVEGLNRLTGKRRVAFSPDGTATTFQLPEKELDEIVSVTRNGEAVTGYTSDLAAGTVTFSSPPAAGTNTVEITYRKGTGSRGDVEGMRYSELFNGSTDTRVFLYGDGTNRTVYSGIELSSGQPSAEYFPALGEVAVGEKNTPVTALVRHYSRLMAYKPNSAWVIQYGTISLEQIAAERELAELELAMKYAAKDSSGSTTGTKTGGGDKQSGDKQPEETGMSWSNVEDWYNKYGATSAKNYVRENYKAMGYTSVSTALAGWENYLVSRKDVAVTESVSNPAAHDWVFVPGYGRLTWKELNDYVDAGKIMKSYNSETGKYTYTMNRSQTNGKPENDLTGTGQNLYYQLQSIPGLTSENKVAMIEDALNNRRITETDANWLLNYLGY